MSNASKDDLGTAGRPGGGSQQQGGGSQQQPGGGSQQQQAGDDRQYGEGNYKATRDYDRGLQEHIKTHDVEREAREAAPKTDEEAREMQRAEDVGKSRGHGDRDDDMKKGPEGEVK